MSTSKRLPDYILHAFNTKTEEKIARVGAAWIQDDDSIRLKINRFVIVPTEPEWILTLFVNKVKKSS